VNKLSREETCYLSREKGLPKSTRKE